MDTFAEFGDALAAVFIVIAVVCMIALAISLVLYIFRSIALYTLAENRRIPNPWLAWIPFANAYLVGALGDDIEGSRGSTTYYRYILLGGYILSPLLMWVGQIGPLISMMRMLALGDGFYPNYDVFPRTLFMTSGVGMLGSTISLAAAVILLIVLYKIYHCYRPGSATSWLVLSIFFPFLQPFFLFSIRNNQPVQTPPVGYYPPPPPPNGQWQAPPPPNGQWQAPPSPPSNEPWQAPPTNDNNNPYGQ